MDGKKYKYEVELLAAYTIAMTAFIIENPEHYRDETLVQYAGVDGVLNTYQAIRKARPKELHPTFDGLLEKRDSGELAPIIKSDIEKCAAGAKENRAKTIEPEAESNPLLLSATKVRNGVRMFERRYLLPAIVEYQRAIALNPKSATAYYEFAYALSEYGHGDPVISNFKKSIELDQDCWLCMMALANVYDDGGNTAEALTLYQRAIDTAPHEARPLFNYAVALNRLKRYQEALNALDKGLALAPKYASILYLRGFVLANLDRCYAGQRSLRDFLELENQGARAERSAKAVKVVVNVDPSNLDPKSLPFEAYVQFGRTRADWINEKYPAKYPNAETYLPTLEEMVDALTEEAKAWKKIKSQKASAVDPELDRLLMIYEAEMVTDFVHSIFLGPDKDQTKAARFVEWAKAKSVSFDPIRQRVTVKWMGRDW
ncbi:MAG: tetratricopeptide repeat protein [Acidobacteriales bacterium]|nr:tetratricopeptide repeat protein [Terriglobales bacterium]